ncbi:ubiquitinyl hydrolase [Eremomyces bilateralis CBS 781.70]|uniref:Ubiquitin carboxyl-terminal hydrolase n=1 Tax=Eremomyces bilateralis CBS 781.70 TaxID=1392243 RepID=A0A6G1FZ39_9PEZI|nr:ubiquitinyl hydrolase [Eremomyces bilateralis CBS 781.70]KAF1810829.1 ubiquitinyl hydrolase [Eremomyces bilateralis CBS 781.70]
MACPHASSSSLRPPRPSESVYREDCTICFDSIDDPAGLDVCLSCYNGGCAGDRQHNKLHYETSKHPLVLNIKRTRKVVDRDEPPQKLTKLAISAETEADRYDTATQVRCLECRVENVDGSQGALVEVVNAVLRANTFAKQEEVKAWEQELTICDHTAFLEQEPPRAIDSQDLGHCSMCELNENLWLCLTCGNLGCGRAQFGGGGGNSHGLAHTDATKHAVAVKLGSLTADGTADIYCYACDDERKDPKLTEHLAHWGINIADRQKTEKSLTEMQIEQNLRWEFSMTTEDGKEIKPVFGKGFTGLKNLGNSCYMNSSLQALFAMPEFQERYFNQVSGPTSTSKPAEDFETQMRKVADGLLSGRYSNPDKDVKVPEGSEEVTWQKGLAPAMFKSLVGKGHEEFSTMRQQDSFEYLLHLFEMIGKSKHDAPLRNPVDIFRFAMEQKLQCNACKKVRYKVDEQENISIPVPIRKVPREANASSEDKETYEPVTLKECLDLFTAPETVELTCPACQSKDGFTKQSLFKTLPTTLAINARRFGLVNWVPTKHDVPVIVEDEAITLDQYLSPGLQPGEELLPEDADRTPKFVPNEEALTVLETMGFPRVQCEHALHATGNTNAEAALNWLMEHMEDDAINQPLNVGGNSSSPAADPASVEMLAALGVEGPLAKKALKETNGDVNLAAEWAFSHLDDPGVLDEVAEENAPTGDKPLAGSAETPANFKLESIVCHKGSSIHAGHYVAFVKKALPEGSQSAWVLFNDEKVAQAVDADEMKKFAYVYFLRRV